MAWPIRLPEIMLQSGRLSNPAVADRRARCDCFSGVVTQNSLEACIIVWRSFATAIRASRIDQPLKAEPDAD